MSAVFLRPAEAVDRPALADLWVAAWMPVFPHIDFAARRAWFLDHWRGQEAGGAQAVVAVAAQAMQGFVLFLPATGYIDQIAVASAAKGKGTAMLLLGFAKSRCPNGLSLKVNQDNPRALRFYQREGFVIEGEGVSEGSGLKLWQMTWCPRIGSTAAPS